MTNPAPAQAPIGEQLKLWRQRRRWSQLDCALEAGISQRHLSFIESGRAGPSRGMVLRLAERLGVPLRERNTMLLAAGFAPVFAERALDDPALAPARAAIDAILKGHEPFPALTVDRHWTLIAANSAVYRLLALVADQSLLQPPINVLRLALAPGGLQPHIVNLAEWRHHLLDRLAQQIAASGDPGLQHLRSELLALPVADEAATSTDYGGIAIPLCLATPFGELKFLSTITVFGTPVDITLSELALELFFPADAATAETLRAMADSSAP